MESVASAREGQRLLLAPLAVTLEVAVMLDIMQIHPAAEARAATVATAVRAATEEPEETEGTEERAGTRTAAHTTPRQHRPQVTATHSPPTLCRQAAEVSAALPDQDTQAEQAVEQLAAGVPASAGRVAHPKTDRPARLAQLVLQELTVSQAQAEPPAPQATQTTTSTT